MDRKYLKEDLVHVYKDNAAKEAGQVLATFRQQPYCRFGYVYYRYNDWTYPAFHRYDGDEEHIYIFLSAPMRPGS